MSLVMQLVAALSLLTCCQLLVTDAMGVKGPRDSSSMIQAGPLATANKMASVLSIDKDEEKGRVRVDLDVDSDVDYADYVDSDLDTDGDDVPEVLNVDTEDLGKQMRVMMEEIDKATATGPQNRSGISKAVNSAVGDMVSKFEAMVMAKMKKAFDYTQSQLNSQAANLEGLNTKTHKSKDVVDGTNMKLSQCRSDEKDALQTYETCHNDGTWANKTWNEACQAKEDAQFHDWFVVKELAHKHKCDLSEDTCAQLEELKKHVDAHFDKAKKMRDVYKLKTEDCDKNEKIAHAKEDECLGKLQAFYDKRAECDQLNFDLKIRMCAFGLSLQEKCQKYTDLNALIVKVRDGKENTKFSEAYRKLQFSKAMTLKCELDAYRGGGVTNDETKSLCASGVDYERDVGVMDYSAAKIMGLMRPVPKEFSCSETSLTIAGATWTTGNSSDTYEKEDVYHPNLSLSPPGEGAFSWCQANTTRGNCRGYSCDTPLWKPKPGQAKVKCILTECSKYECCDPAGGTVSAAAPAAAAPAATPPAPEAPAAAAAPVPAAPAAAPA